MARRICNAECPELIAEAERFRDESFPHFDLTVLTEKQLNVLVMRYRGLLSWRKIAQFDGVHFTSIVERHDAAVAKLQRQIKKYPYDSRKGRGMYVTSRIATRDSDRPAATYAKWSCEGR